MKNIVTTRACSIVNNAIRNGYELVTMRPTTSDLTISFMKSETGSAAWSVVRVTLTNEEIAFEGFASEAECTLSIKATMAEIVAAMDTIVRVSKENF